jgi:hypothetical protein
MKPTDFESQLQQRAFRDIPAEWRTKVLSAARLKTETPGWMGRLVARFSDLLWPCPQAWVGLAAAWAFIAVLQLGMSGTNAETKVRVTPQMVAAWKEQQKALAELIDPYPPAPPELPLSPGAWGNKRRETFEMV